MGGLIGINDTFFKYRGIFENNDNLTDNGSSKTGVNYEGLYSFAANRTILQFKLTKDGTLMARRNGDFMYHEWSEWKTIVNL